MAEHALKTLLVGAHRYIVGSAGIEIKAQSIHDWVRSGLQTKGVDVAGHISRQLTREIVDAADLVIAMGRDHQTFVRERFGREAPLFNRLCLDRDESIQDVHEAIPAWEVDHDQARTYVYSVIEHIWEATPSLISRFPTLG